MEETESENWSPDTIKYFGPENRAIAIFGEINENIALCSISQLLELEASDPLAPITVLINSPGGALYDAIAIYEVMHLCTCPIRVIVVGYCASAALLILVGGDERLATENSTFFIHQVISDPPTFNAPSIVKDFSEAYKRTTQLYHNIIIKRTGMPKIWQDLFKESLAKTFSVQEARKYGLIHKCPTEKNMFLAKTISKRKKN